MASETVEPVRRPPNLGAILDISTETEKIDCELYTRFLRYAEISRNNAFHSRLNVSASFHYSSLSQPVEQNKSSAMKTNGSLLEIFKYYAKLEPPNLVQVTTFADVSVSNDTLSIIEFITFLRDFRVIPRLLTKREVRQVWGTIANDFVASGKGTFKKMDLEVFKDAVVRLGICCFCKPGLRNLIEKVNGFEISAKHAVEYFSRYLHLDDERWVRNHIGIAGKESQGARNYRSAGDFDVKAMIDNLEDMATDKLTKRSGMKKKSTKIITSIPCKRFQPQAPWPSNPAESLLPEKLRNQLYPDANAKPSGQPDLTADAEEAVISTTNANTSSNTNTNTNTNVELIRRLSLTGREREAEATFEEDDEDDDCAADEDSDGEAAAKAMAAIATDSSIGKLLEVFYELSLIKLVTKYCRYQAKRVNSRTIFSEGAFLDMGLVPPSAQCGIRLQLTNKSPEDLYFDVTMRDMDCSNVYVTTHAAMLIPGLPRVVDISFTINPGDTSVIGYIDLHSYASKSGSVVALSCPVYYRVGSSFAETNRQICTEQNLSALVARYCKKKKPTHNMSEFQPIPRCLTNTGEQLGLDCWTGSPAQAIRAWKRNLNNGTASMKSLSMHGSGIADESMSRALTAPSQVLLKKSHLPSRSTRNPTNSR